MKAATLTVFLVMWTSSAAAQTESLRIKVDMKGEKVTAVYTPYVEKVCSKTAEELIKLLSETSPFKLWNLTTGKADEVITFAFEQSGESSINVTAALTHNNRPINKWDASFMGHGEKTGEHLPPADQDAPGNLARIIQTYLVRVKQREMVHDGLALIPFSSQPPVRSKSYSFSIVLPLPADNNDLAASLSTAEFRVVCDYASRGDFEVFAVSKPSRKEAYSAGLRVGYSALVAVGQRVDDGTGAVSIHDWKGAFEKIQPITLYLIETAASDVRISTR
jgi:hypothetical protein